MSPHSLPRFTARAPKAELMTLRDLMSVRDLAEEFPQLGERWVRRCVDERRVGVYKIGGRVLVSRAEFAEFLAAGRIEPVAS